MNEVLIGFREAALLRDAVREHSAFTPNLSFSGHAALLRLLDALNRIGAFISGFQSKNAESIERAWDAVSTRLALEAVDELQQALKAAESVLEPALAVRLRQVAEKLDRSAASLSHKARVIRRSSTRQTGREQPTIVPRSGTPYQVASLTTALSSDVVRFGASAPRAVAPKSAFVARFIAYAEDDVVHAVELLRHPGQVNVGALRLERGTKGDVVLSGSGLTVEGGVSGSQSFVWTGHTLLLTFEVEARELREGENSVLRFDVIVDGFVLARIRLELAISAGAATVIHNTSVGHSLSRKAFASYSSRDRLRVLDRVAAIRIAAAVQVFLDCHDLNPSDAWKPRLEAEIDHCDAFILFWSNAAAKSRWVHWEWKRALHNLGLENMQFHPLENGVRPLQNSPPFTSRIPTWI